MLVVSVAFRYYELHEMGYQQVTPGRMVAPTGPDGQPLPPPQVNLAAYALRIAVAVVLVISGSIALLYVSLNDLILKPVRQIIAANEAVSAGREHDARIDPATMPEKEWARIVESRERMLSKQEEHSDLLEAKIEERTRQLRETSAELIQAEKLATLGAVSASFAHELSHPLTAIYFSLEPAIKEAAATPEVARRLEEVKSSLATIQTLVGNFKSFSRQSEAARLLDLNSPVRRACDIMSHQLHNRSIRLDVKLGDRLPEVWADDVLVQQIAMNLLANARDAVAEAGRNGNGRIEVRTREEGGGVVLQVRDNGCGIPADQREQIFKPFFTTKPPAIGTGLGLPIVKTIVEGLGGMIDVETAPGEGTMFAIAFAPHAPVAVEQGPNGDRTESAG